MTIASNGRPPGGHEAAGSASPPPATSTSGERGDRERAAGDVRGAARPRATSSCWPATSPPTGSPSRRRSSRTPAGTWVSRARRARQPRLARQPRGRARRARWRRAGSCVLERSHRFLSLLRRGGRRRRARRASWAASPARTSRTSASRCCGASTRETTDEVEAVDAGLRGDRGLRPFRIVLLHYAPTTETLEGEPREIWAFLGTDRLAAPIARARPRPRPPRPRARRHVRGPHRRGAGLQRLGAGAGRGLLAVRAHRRPAGAVRGPLSRLERLDALTRRRVRCQPTADARWCSGGRGARGESHGRRGEPRATARGLDHPRDERVPPSGRKHDVDVACRATAGDGAQREVDERTGEQLRRQGRRPGPARRARGWRAGRR